MPHRAALLVEKIIQYETSPDNDGDWQNRIALLADDEDYSRHLDQTEDVATYLEENHPVFNLEKIYFDAFLQEVNPGGHRYPDANKSINDNIFKGLPGNDLYWPRWPWRTGTGTCAKTGRYLWGGTMN
jgi:hypothetical protein